MGGCQLCKKDVDLPFRCNYCGQLFCAEHRLPENHLCPNLIRGGPNIRPHEPQVSSYIKYPSRTKKTSTSPGTFFFLMFIGIIAFFVVYVYPEIDLKIDVNEFKEETNTLIEKIQTELDTTINITENQTNKVWDLEPLWGLENVYGNYSFGLVKESGSTIVNSYGDFIVLINNKNAVNPKYNKLIKFLERDKTDEYPYKPYIITPLNSYYGAAESHVNLTLVREIVDGDKDMPTPRICVDFAMMLHNNAEMSGFRCAFVSIEIGEGHALVAFNTTDRGLVYIDSTGVVGSGPPNCDKIIDSLELNAHYVPRSLFPSPRWSSTWGDMGIITKIYMTWDGDWN